MHCTAVDNTTQQLFYQVSAEVLDRHKMVKHFSLILFALVDGTAGLDCSFQESYPRHLVTYKLGEGEEISLDGNMDEEAWDQVEWSQDFTDIRYYYPTFIP